MRNIRRDIKEAIDKLEKDKKISQDEQKRSLEELEKVSHSETKKIEDLSAMKEKEVMEIRGRAFGVYRLSLAASKCNARRLRRAVIAGFFNKMTQSAQRFGIRRSCRKASIRSVDLVAVEILRLTSPLQDDIGSR